MPTAPKILVVQCAALSYDCARRDNLLSRASGLSFQPLQPVFPAVTCCAQASIRCATAPSQHGIIANGLFNRRSRRVEFWNQSAYLIDGERVWSQARRAGRSVAMLCFQQSLGEDADFILSPAPVHKHHGGMIDACQSRPESFAEELSRAVGRPFRLRHYWGPSAGSQSSRWISDATAALMQGHAPDLIFTYLPQLDYALQKFGPAHPASTASIAVLGECLQGLTTAAAQHGYELLIWGDYAITAVQRPIFPNRALREAGLFCCRPVGRMRYPDLYDSRAFAMCDHQVAHVFVKDPGDLPATRAALAALPGIEGIQSAAEAGLDHPNAGELVLLAEADAWFAYPWWQDAAEAPDYANHVDIHNKIGFDPCELFWSIPFLRSSSDASKPRGSHGRCDVPAAFAVSAGLGEFRQAESTLALAQALKTRLAPS
jgi:predicted AlkP superfamily pyrophosphatase or phosphodiesterase